MTDLPIRRFQGSDGTELVFRELGEGRPVVLFHGYLSNGLLNWVRFGHAARLAELGYRVVLPDLRGHGDSAKPHDAAAYRPEGLVDDGFALLAHLGLHGPEAAGEGGYDLGGYSMGGRTATRMLVRGARPDRAVVAGVGLEGLLDTDYRRDRFRHVLTHLGTFPVGSPDWEAEAFLRRTGGDPVALLHLLGTSVDTSREELARVEVETLLLMGAQDRDHGSAEDLAALLPKGRCATVPGTHMSVVPKPAFGAAIAEFLGPAA